MTGTIKKRTLKDKTDKLEKNLYYRIFKLILPILAIGGLAFAIYDNYESNQLSEDILERISTKFIGNFPTQIPEITNQIRLCSKKLVIATDHPAYGCFSAPDDFQAYRLAIDEKLSKSNSPAFESLVLITYDRQRRRKELVKQFAIDKSKLDDKIYFEEYLEDDKRNWEKWQAKLFNFISTEDKPKTITTWNELFDEIEKLNLEMANKIENNPRGEVRQIGIGDEPLPIYYWLFEDDKHALISFHSYGKLTKEATISTSHPPLIEYIKGMSNDIEENWVVNSTASHMPTEE